MRTLNLPQGAPLTDEQFWQSATKRYEELQLQKQYEAQLIFPLLVFGCVGLVILYKLWNWRKAIGSSLTSGLIYVLGRGYRLKNKASARLDNLANQVKKAAEN